MTMLEVFQEAPTIALLQWLGRGSLKQNLRRAVRLWVWLRCLYGEEDDLLSLPDPFTYADWRDAFFAGDHPKGDEVPALHDPICACAKTMAEWLFGATSGGEESVWRQAFQDYDPISNQTLDTWMGERLFGVTRRSLAEDLKQLAELGWLTCQGRDYYRVESFPAYPADVEDVEFSDQSVIDLDFLLPNQLAAIAEEFAGEIGGEQRFFLHVDYIFSADRASSIGDVQELLKKLWSQEPVPPVWIKILSARLRRIVDCVIYPVCIYYVQRAVYLSAFGETPSGTVGWHNYRLDRVQHITPLTWEDATIPEALQQRYRSQVLPTPADIQVQMRAVWGFDFYLPPQLMVLRFERSFHDYYIRGTFRHHTFKPIPYGQVADVIRRYAPVDQQRGLQELLSQRSPQDAYYRVMYRRGDRNVELRLRAWRPKGEVLLPWELRQAIAQEVAAEAQLYGLGLE